jgi:hypothetical protein
MNPRSLTAFGDKLQWAALTMPHAIDILERTLDDIIGVYNKKPARRL